MIPVSFGLFDLVHFTFGSHFSVSSTESSSRSGLENRPAALIKAVLCFGNIKYLIRIRI
jgi:hypothetical protein